MSLSNSVKAAAFAIVGTAILATSLPVQAQVQSGTILVRGEVKGNCYISVAETTPVLDLTPGNTINQQVGTVTQNCNKRSGYNLTVASTKCDSGASTGARLGSTDIGAPAAYMDYTVSFDNFGTVPDTSNLLDTNCSQAAANITAKVTGDQVSTVSVQMTVPGDAEAANYNDTLTITMTVP